MKELGILGLFAVLIIVILAVAGWIINIAKVLFMSWEFTMELAIRLIGIPIPVIGAIVGWM